MSSEDLAPGACYVCVFIDQCSGAMSGRPVARKTCFVFLRCCLMHVVIQDRKDFKMVHVPTDGNMADLKKLGGRS